MSKTQTALMIGAPLAIGSLVLALLWRTYVVDTPGARDHAPGVTARDTTRSRDDAGEGATESSRELTLYSSADDEYLRLVLDRFTAKTGVKVEAVGDTEATKTFGLVRRLIAEKDRPRADVWWSSEPMSSISLAEAGVLAPMDPAPRLDDATPWPSELRDGEGRWFAFARRARVIVYSTSRVKDAEAPTHLRDLLDPRWKSRVGMARPQFGTTRTHLAALVALAGEARAETWLSALRDHGVRLYDGNAAVVRGIANAEIDVGLTDSDDVFAGLRNGWAVSMTFEPRDAEPAGVDGLPSFGTIMLPNTVGVIRKPGGVSKDARALADFLLSAEVETILAESDSRNVPVRAALAKVQAEKDPRTRVAEPASPDLSAVSRASPAAAAIADRVLK
ncbi:MAG: extracellular solute-binding protein [Phycisphaerae bacterium]|nr:extracellular solute-binding protein [Phycisphaerae bacterium]